MSAKLNRSGVVVATISAALTAIIVGGIASAVQAPANGSSRARTAPAVGDTLLGASVFSGGPGWVQVPANTRVRVPWDKVSYDPTHMFSGAKPTRLTIKTRGLYLLQGQVLWDNGATGHRDMQLRVNGNSLGWATNVEAFDEPSNWMPQRTVTQLVLNAGDYVELEVWHDTPDTRALVTIAHLGPALTVTRLGAVPGG